MRLPDEWAAAAREAAERPEVGPTYRALLRADAREFERLSRDFTGWAVRFGEHLNKLAEGEALSGRLEPEYVRDVLDRLYDQRSYQ